MNIQFITNRLRTLANEIEEQIEEEKRENEFKILLKPYEIMFYNFYNSLKSDLQTKTKEELLEILNATKYPSKTNCSWGLYDANKYINEICKDILSSKYKINYWND